MNCSGNFTLINLISFWFLLFLVNLEIISVAKCIRRDQFFSALALEHDKTNPSTSPLITWCADLSVWISFLPTVPHSEMADSGKDMVVDTGSTINLTCIISRSPSPPSYVFWYYNDRMMNYHSELDGRGQVVLTKHPLKENTFISRLILRNARHNDSGNYSCSPVNVDSSSIYVHVLQRM